MHMKQTDPTAAISSNLARGEGMQAIDEVLQHFGPEREPVS